MPIFQPTDISGCFMWFRSSDIGLGAATGYINSWPDMSGSGNNLTPTTETATLMPTYIPNIINGYPVARFNGTTNYLQKANNASLQISDKKLSLFCVFKTNNASTTQCIYSSDHGFATAAQASFIVGLNLTTISSWFYSWGRDVPGPPTKVETGNQSLGSSWYIRSDIFPTGGNLNFRRDGSPVSTGTGGSSISTQNVLKLGLSSAFSYYFNGDLAEVIGYNRNIGSGEVIQVEDYLKFKYNLGPVGGPALFTYATSSPTGAIYTAIPLDVLGGTPTSTGSCTLYTTSFGSSSSGMSLYIPSKDLCQSGMSLYTHSTTTISSGWPLYIRGISSYSGGIPLYLGSSIPDVSGMSLYIGPISTYATGVSLFTQGGTESKILPLYIHGITSYSGSFTLYTSASLPISSGLSAYMTGYAMGISGMSLYTGSSTVFDSGMSLYIAKTVSVPSSIHLYMQGAFSGGGATTMFIPGQFEYTWIQAGMSLHGVDSITGYTPLYINCAAVNPSSVSMYMRGSYIHNDGMNLFVKQLPAATGTSSVPFYINSVTAGTSGLSNHTDLYMYAYGIGNSMPMFLSNNQDAPTGYEAMPMFLKTVEIVNPTDANITAFLGNYSSESGKRVKLFIRGDGTMDGASVSGSAMNLFLKQDQGNYNSLPLYINSQGSSVLPSTLYMQGVYNYESGRSLFIRGTETTGTFSLYINAGSQTSSGIGMSIFGKPEIGQNTILYTYGF